MLGDRHGGDVGRCHHVRVVIFLCCAVEFALVFAILNRSGTRSGSL